MSSEEMCNFGTVYMHVTWHIKSIGFTNVVLTGPRPQISSSINNPNPLAKINTYLYSLYSYDNYYSKR